MYDIKYNSQDKFISIEKKDDIEGKLG